MRQFPLTPNYTVEQLYPPGSVYLRATSLANAKTLYTKSWQRESSSGSDVAVAGSMPYLLHENALTPVARRFFEDSGVAIGSNIATFSDCKNEAELISKALSADGKFATPFPPAESLVRDEDLLVPHALYNWLNDKRNIGELCPAEHVPQRQIIDQSEFSILLEMEPECAVFLKGVVKGVCGGGFDVYHCQNKSEWSAALDWWAGRSEFYHAAIIETSVQFTTSWCVSYSILDDEIIFLGAAEQIFSAAGQQIGSVVDPAIQPPQEAFEVAQAICTNAQGRGYRGVAGFDMGVAPDGRSTFFDLNFRSVLCLAPNLLQHGDSGEVVAVCSAVVPASLTQALECVRQMANRSRFLPTRLYDGSVWSEGKAPSVVTGVVGGPTKAAALAEVAVFNASFDSLTG